MRKLIGTGGVLFVTVVVLFVLTAGVHRSCGPFYYSSDPIRARVIDETTAQPVEGAVVVPIWILDSFWYGPRALHAYETVTDSKGEFVIPAMRKRRPWLTYLKFNDPKILIYKPGFRIRGLTNRDLYVRPFVKVGEDVQTTTLPDGRIMAAPSRYSSASKRTCFWNGKTIPLEHDPKDPDSAVRSYDYLWTDARMWLPPDQFPEVWKALIAGYERIPKDSWRNRWHPNDYLIHQKEREQK